MCSALEIAQHAFNAKLAQERVFTKQIMIILSASIFSNLHYHPATKQHNGKQSGLLSARDIAEKKTL